MNRFQIRKEAEHKFSPEEPFTDEAWMVYDTYPQYKQDVPLRMSKAACETIAALMNKEWLNFCRRPW